MYTSRHMSSRYHSILQSIMCTVVQILLINYILENFVYQNNNIWVTHFCNLSFIIWIIHSLIWILHFFRHEITIFSPCPNVHNKSAWYVCYPPHLCRDTRQTVGVWLEEISTSGRNRPRPLDPGRLWEW